ncbi:MAG: alpha/beta hydrolase [Bacillota bacterium]|uniref:alpha/beta hydrolase n=1 Tax=Desulfurispora thermophila TaxID=265470 RepID=UPI00036D5245|nr:alpha/beta fold hydrolase [Desulfurispora thermophila]
MVEKMFIPNHNQKQLAALLFTPARRHENTPLIIFCHGFTGSKEGRGKALELAEMLISHHYACLLFDFSGHGESQGEFENITLSGQIADLNSVIAYSHQLGWRKIITLGRSFGGTTVLFHAANQIGLCGVCAWAAPARVYELFAGFTDCDLETLVDPNEKIELAGDEGIVYVKKALFTDLKKYNYQTSACNMPDIPVLLIHGTHDSVVPLQEAYLWQEALGKKASLVVISQGDHQFSQHYQLVWQEFINWLQVHFPA